MMSKKREVLGVISYDEKWHLFRAVLGFEDGRKLETEGFSIIDALQRSVFNVYNRFLPDYVDESEGIKGINFEPGELEGLQIHFRLDRDIPGYVIGYGEARFVDAFNFMAFSHYGEKDAQGMDFYFHAVRVSRSVDPVYGDVALLHDLFEHTDTTPRELQDFYVLIEDDHIDSLVALTRKEGESYRDYICRVKRDKVARVVKIKALEDHLNITRLGEVTEKDLKRLNNLLHAWRYLHGFDDDLALITD